MEQIVVQTGSEPHGLRSRLAWVDVAKGLGIVLLVVLHVEAASDNAVGRPIVWVLKLFRMPMFFIVSGMLFSPRGHLDMAARKTRSLLVPYVSFMIAIWIALVLRYLLLGVHTPYVSLHGIKDMILGGERLRGEYGVFWFMTGLFFTQMLYNAIIRRWQDPLSRQVIASVGSVLLAGYALWFVAPKFATPLALGTVPFGIAFMWFGHLMKIRSFEWRVLLPMSATVTLMAAALGLAGLAFDMDVKYAEPGVPFVSIALAVAMTWAFFELAKPLARVPVLSVCLIKLGDAAMVVMFLHQYVHWTMRLLGVTSDGLMVAAGVVVPFLLWLLMKRSTLLRAIFLGDERSQRSIVTMTQWPSRWGRSRA